MSSIIKNVQLQKEGQSTMNLYLTFHLIWFFYHFFQIICEITVLLAAFDIFLMHIWHALVLPFQVAI